MRMVAEVLGSRAKSTHFQSEDCWNGVGIHTRSMDLRVSLLLYVMEDR